MADQVVLQETKVSTEKYEVVHERADAFYPEFERKGDLKHQTHYCPGCGHGVAHKLIAEALDDLGLQDKTILVSPVGCSVFAYYYFDVGNVQVAHGRAPAAATGLKRACPDKIVIAYQGDGDLAAIGTAEIVHAANRGEKISVFFVNNAIYGMTGGQMAPTTLVDQKSTTSPWGRRPINEGFPLHMAEMLASLEAPVYIERVALSDNKNIMKARRAVRKALELQRAGAGFTFVEILSPCPTIWGKDPVEARKWVAEKMIPNFPLNVFRDRAWRFRTTTCSSPQNRGRTGGGRAQSGGRCQPCPRNIITTASSASRLPASVGRVSCCSASCWPRWACARASKSAGCRRMVRRCGRAARTVTFACRRIASGRRCCRILQFWSR
jgi:pyruvate/2-oxoacid:ferredoxin oxidoreductase beta subunit